MAEAGEQTPRSWLESSPASPRLHTRRWGHRFVLLFTDDELTQLNGEGAMRTVGGARAEKRGWIGKLFAEPRSRKTGAPKGVREERACGT